MVGRRRIDRLDDLRKDVHLAKTVEDSLGMVLEALEEWGYSFPRMYRFAAESEQYILVDSLGLSEEFKETRFGVGDEATYDPLLEQILQTEDVLVQTDVFTYLEKFYAENPAANGKDKKDPLTEIKESAGETAKGLVGLGYEAHSNTLGRIQGLLVANFDPREKKVDVREKEMLQKLGWLVGDKVIRKLEGKLLEKMNRKLEGKQRELEELIDRLKLQVDIDGFSNLYNHSRFNRDLGNYLQVVKEEEKSFYLLLIDCDHFKELNDQHGHLAGDEYIKRLSRLLGSVRGAESYRIGGDEFALVVESNSREYVVNLAKELLADVKEISVPREVTLSIGVAQAKPSFSEEEWRVKADKALYLAKEQHDAVAYLKKDNGDEDYLLA